MHRVCLSALRCKSIYVRPLIRRTFLTFNPRSQRESNDVFGIENVTGDDVMGVDVGPIKVERVEAITSVEQSLRERELVTSYGIIRFDNQNVVKVHGQFDENFDVESYIEESARSEREMNFIDEQYFGGIVSETNENVNDEKYNLPVEEGLANEAESKDVGEVLEDSNFIDKQYFLSEAEGVTYETNITKEEEILKNNDDGVKCLNSEPKGNKRYQMAKFTFDVTKEWKDVLAQNLMRLDNIEEKNCMSVYSGVQFAKLSPLKNINEIETELLSTTREEEIEENDGLEIEGNEKQPLTADENKVEKQRPRTAFEYYQQLKSGAIEPESDSLREKLKKLKVSGENMDYNKLNPTGVSLDSQGFRDFKEQCIDYSKFRNEEIAWHLKKNVLFDDCEILAINKPYGITCHGNKSTASSPLLHDLLPLLAEMVNTKALYPVHRLDKDTTGVLLLAKTKETAALLLSMFKERKIKKYYTAITRGVPDEKEGIIDIPMEETKIEKRERMALRPDVEKDYQRVVKPSSKAKRAVTHYKVKAWHGNAALLEIFTETGVKHQIRCHLGFGLRTPILGDHKYSYLDRLVPQKLPADMLLKLNVRQSKVRNIPLHLHCRLVQVPEIGINGSTISIAAHLPSNFKRNAQALNLK